MNADLRKTIDLDFPGHNRETAQRAQYSGLAPYGFCPICRRIGVSRQRCPNGNDVCFGGHEYPSRDALMALSIPPGASAETREAPLTVSGPPQGGPQGTTALDAPAGGIPLGVIR